MAFLVNPYVHGAGAVSGYLLDTYSATVAYSLRQLKTGVTNVVRVRRSPGNQERDFSPTEVTDGTLTSFIGSGKDGYVVSLYDQSGNGLNITQSSASSQAQIVSNGSVLTLNSVSAIKFDGSNDYLTRGTSLNAIHGNNWSFSSVANNELTNSAGAVWSNRLASGSNKGCLTLCDRTTSARHTNIDTGSTSQIYNYLATDNTNSQRLQSFFLDSSDGGEAFLNGVSQEAFTMTQSLDSGGFFDVGRQSLGSLYHNGYIQEVIIFASDESSNRTAIESDINTYYSIY
jgi:hypothetical protein